MDETGPVLFVTSLTTLHYLSGLTLVMGTQSTFLATLDRHLNSSSCFSTREA
jgi:hypothetical protein